MEDNQKKGGQQKTSAKRGRTLAGIIVLIILGLVGNRFMGDEGKETGQDNYLADVTITGAPTQALLPEEDGEPSGSGEMDKPDRVKFIPMFVKMLFQIGFPAKLIEDFYFSTILIIRFRLSLAIFPVRPRRCLIWLAFIVRPRRCPIWLILIFRPGWSFIRLILIIRPGQCPIWLILIFRPGWSFIRLILIIHPRRKIKLYP